MAGEMMQPNSIADMLSFTKAFEDKVGNLAEGFRPIDQSKVDSIIGSGALGSTLGFNTPRDVFGMSPEDFYNSMKSYKDPMEVMTRGAAMSEAVTGKSKIAQAKINAATSAMQPMSSAILQDSSQRFTGGQNQLSRDQSQSQFEMNYDLNKTNADRNYTLAVKNSDKQDQQFWARYNQSNDHFNRQLTMMKNASGGGTSGGAGGPFTDTKSAVAQENMFQDYMNKPKETVKTNSIWRANEAAARALAYNGAKVGHYMPLVDFEGKMGFNDSSFVTKEHGRIKPDGFVLYQNGWHYSYEKDGKRWALPGVQIQVPMGGSSSSSGNSGYTQVRRNAPEE